MSNGNELQKDDRYLPGGLGTIQVGNQVRDIKQVFKGKDGSVTITIGATEPKPLIIGGKKTGISYQLGEKTITLNPSNNDNK
jgi:hypothetical protein